MPKFTYVLPSVEKHYKLLHFAVTLYIKPLRAWAKKDQSVFCSYWLAAEPDKIVYDSSVLGITESHDNNKQMKTVIYFDECIIENNGYI